MRGLNWAEMASSVLFVAVCAMVGALVLMQRMAEICEEEGRYDLPSGNANLIGAVVGGLAGVGIAAIGIYYYLFVGKSVGWIEWVGPAAYALILGASAAHAVVLIHIWNRVEAEESDLRGSGKGAQKGTLSLRRRTELGELRRTVSSYPELQARDEEAVEELVGVLGERLLTAQRALGRIPFYGYLGTVCGILLMAQQLTRLDEATETFRVLRDMAGGLVLAFQTTLVALLAYLPLRKAFDALSNRVAGLERAWLKMRDEALRGRQS